MGTAFGIREDLSGCAGSSETESKKNLVSIQLKTGVFPTPEKRRCNKKAKLTFGKKTSLVDKNHSEAIDGG